MVAPRPAARCRARAIPYATTRTRALTAHAACTTVPVRLVLRCVAALRRARGPGATRSATGRARCAASQRCLQLAGPILVSTCLDNGPALQRASLGRAARTEQACPPAPSGVAGLASFLGGRVTAPSGLLPSRRPCLH
ncbi:hypothetical protein GQ53DRAFT_82428 [Thozetella sp. PMI_491]|nr:hypothetical protein GQ53DRAFT_82428 [Thozetella sp. PMI_491]